MTTQLDEFAKRASESMIKSHKIIYENLGITTNLSKIPEYQEYLNYAYPRNQFLRLYRELFKNNKIIDLQKKAQVALVESVTKHKSTSKEM